MISTVRLWRTLSSSAKTGTSGYETAQEFNDNLAAVQESLMSLLAPLYPVNDKIQDMLAPFVISVPVSTTKPLDYVKFISATISGNPVYPITPSQVTLYNTSPVRKPTATNNLSYWYLEDGDIKFLTNGVPAGTMVYIRKAAESLIVLTEVSTPDSDYVTPSSTTDLEWPDMAFNIILYMMMERLGLEMKEQILMEFGSIGIQRETVKL